MDRLPWYSGHPAGANLIFTAGIKPMSWSVWPPANPASCFGSGVLESGN